MKKYKIGKAIEVWGIYMGLCEEFPDLYDKYVEKIEDEMKDYKPEFRTTDEEKEQNMKKIWHRIKNENRE